MAKYRDKTDWKVAYNHDEVTWEEMLDGILAIDPTDEWALGWVEKDAEEKAKKAKKSGPSAKEIHDLTAKNLSMTHRSFSDIQSDAKLLFSKVENSRSEMDKTIEGMKGTYTESAISKKKAEMQADLTSMVKGEIEIFNEDVRRTLEAKEKAIAGIVAAAPTEEQLRLLEALKMQGDGITEQEIEAIVPALTGNYRALSTLRNIARNANLGELYIPPQYDYEQLTESLKWTKSAIECYVEALEEFVQTGKWPETGSNFQTALAQFFFEGYDLDEYRQNAIETLDGNAQAGKIKVRVEPRTLTERERFVISNMFDSLDPRVVRDEVNEVAKSPEMRKLISLHDVYGPMLDPVSVAE